jgi:hypothetical protein
MFEQEIELEKKQGSALPLLLIVGLIVVFVGVAAYYLAESRKVLTTPEATTVINSTIAAQAPVTVSFEIGNVKDSWDEGPRDPRYRLLEKAGVVKIGKAKGSRIPVAFTDKGHDLVQQLPGVKQTKEDDGNIMYVIPLAARKLVEVSKIDMHGPERATVEYSWKWETNAIGENFDASSAGVQSFNGWDRAKLIDKYGARFYHGAAERASIALAKGDHGWLVAND